jgi:hypothetical protein
MKKFLIILSGARQDILAQCPTERIKFQSLGWAIFITSAIATVSMWFALTSVLGLNPFLAFPIALLWGLVIMGIDRWLVTSMPTDGSRKWTIALPRLVLAMLLGSLISTPLVLRIFQSEINTQVALIRQQQASEFLTGQQNSSVHQQVTYWTSQVAALQRTINSRGTAPVNPSTDPVVQSLTRQRTSELTLEQQYYQQWQCQLYGGRGCTVKGNGPLAQASHRSYLQAVTQVATLTNEIQQRGNELSRASAESNQTRYQQAVSAMPAAQAQLNAARQQENTLRSNFEARNNVTNGLLIRLQALNQLSGKDFTLNSARLLLFLLFLVIECLPVTVKLLQKPGNYEKILHEAARLELRNARKVMRTSSRSFGMSSAGAVPEAREALMEEIWRPHTRMADMPGWRNSAETDPHLDRPGEWDEETRADEVFRGLPDIGGGESHQRRGGTELVYDDDEL